MPIATAPALGQFGRTERSSRHLSSWEQGVGRVIVTSNARATPCKVESGTTSVCAGKSHKPLSISSVRLSRKSANVGNVRSLISSPLRSGGSLGRSACSGRIQRSSRKPLRLSQVAFSPAEVVSTPGARSVCALHPIRRPGLVTLSRVQPVIRSLAAAHVTLIAKIGHSLAHLASPWAGGVSSAWI
jgi:hypothetical protein